VGRRTVDEMWDCAVLDNLPGLACRTDFGLEPPNEVQAFGALQYAIKRGLVTKPELTHALGDGPALTEIASKGGNPYACEFHTAWDDLGEEEEGKDYTAEGGA